MWDRLSWSAGQFHYETEGFRINNDQQQDIFNLFFQAGISYRTSIQVELRQNEVEKGDLALRFDPDNFLRNLRQTNDTRTARFGLRHEMSPDQDLIVSLVCRDFDFSTSLENDLTLPLPFPIGPFTTRQRVRLPTTGEGYMGEVQYLRRSELFHVIAGGGYFDADIDDRLILNFSPQFPPILVDSDTMAASEVRHGNVYGYSYIRFPEQLIWTLGAGMDFFDDTGQQLERDQFNPKAGVVWQPTGKTIVRAAVFRTLKRQLISNQTVEPTQVAGFNQFFDDANGTRAWRYGIGLDQQFSSKLYGGLELSRRDLEVPFTVFQTGETHASGWDEDVFRTYGYWAPLSWCALALEYRYERFQRDLAFSGPENLVDLKTHRIPIQISLFSASGLRAAFKPTYVYQEGDLGNPKDGITPISDHFWVTDLSFSYRFPKRVGILSVEVKNLFDDSFRFQDTDPANPVVYPERYLLGKITFAF